MLNSSSAEHLIEGYCWPISVSFTLRIILSSFERFWLSLWKKILIIPCMTMNLKWLLYKIYRYLWTNQKLLQPIPIEHNGIFVVKSGENDERTVPQVVLQIFIATSIVKTVKAGTTSYISCSNCFNSLSVLIYWPQNMNPLN